MWANQERMNWDRENERQGERPSWEITTEPKKTAHVVEHYTEETNVTAHIIVDRSAAMLIVRYKTLKWKFKHMVLF